MHLDVLHGLALVLAAARGVKAPGLSFGEDGLGLPLWAVYVAWLTVVASLYVPCRRYARLKARHPQSLLRFV